MTESELSAIEAEAAAHTGEHEDACLCNRYRALVAEVRRLRGLINEAEWAGALPGASYRGCPWCTVELEFHPSNQKPHDATCAAFGEANDTKRGGSP